MSPGMNLDDSVPLTSLHLALGSSFCGQILSGWCLSTYIDTNMHPWRPRGSDHAPSPWKKCCQQAESPLIGEPLAQTQSSPRWPGLQRTAWSPLSFAWIIPQVLCAALCDVPLMNCVQPAFESRRRERRYQHFQVIISWLETQLCCGSNTFRTLPHRFFHHVSNISTSWLSSQTMHSMPGVKGGVQTRFWKTGLDLVLKALARQPALWLLNTVWFRTHSDKRWWKKKKCADVFGCGSKAQFGLWGKTAWGELQPLKPALNEVFGTMFVSLTDHTQPHCLPFYRHRWHEQWVLFVYLMVGLRLSSCSMSNLMYQRLWDQCVTTV